MRIFAALILVLFCVTSVQAEMFQYNNPFPTETGTERFNNIYGTEPAVVQKEVQQKKKSWWKIREDVTEPTVEPSDNFKTIHEGIQKDNFYVFSDEKQ